MLENYDDNASRCLRCSAKLEADEEVEYFDFNGMGAMCNHCASGFEKHPDSLTVSIGRFLNGNVI